MHEWALAESVIVSSIKAAEKEKLSKIKEIIILIGELQQIENEIFEFALNEVVKTYDILKEVKFTIEIEKTKLKCNNCNENWGFDKIKKKINEDESEAIHFIPEVAFVHTRCPKCGSPDFEIISGRGVSISQIKGEK